MLIFKILNLIHLCVNQQAPGNKYVVCGGLVEF